MSRSPEFEAAYQQAVDSLSQWIAERTDQLMAAAPKMTKENPTMREFSIDETYDDLDLVAFQSKPRLISATVMDEPFAITHGEWYYAQFQAGDYLCFDANGKPFGMTPERFHEEYELTDDLRFKVDDVTEVYRATFADDGSVLLEPLHA